MTQDESHLRLLSIFHYVLAVPTVLFSSLFLLHVLFGLGILIGLPAIEPSRDAPPAAFGLFFIAIGGGVVLAGWSMAACLVVAGRSLAQRKRYMFCLVLAGISCVVCNPLGTVLGVFTIVVLMRPSVKALFEVA